MPGRAAGGPTRLISSPLRSSRSRSRPRRSLESGDRRPPLYQPSYGGVPPPQGLRQTRDLFAHRTPPGSRGCRRRIPRVGRPGLSAVHHQLQVVSKPRRQSCRSDLAAAAERHRPDDLLPHSGAAAHRSSLESPAGLRAGLIARSTEPAPDCSPCFEETSQSGSLVETCAH
jgi:hypothetical protein